MITVTRRVKLILKALGYTIAILIGACILAIIVVAITANQDLGPYTFWGTLFLGILAVLTDELRKREALSAQHAHERTAAVASSHTPELTEYALGTHRVNTAIVVDLNVGIFELHVDIHTNWERSKCVPSQHAPTPTNQSIQDCKEAHIHDHNIHALQAIRLK